MQAARAGDRRALETLLERHHERLRAVCLRIAGPDGEDATQETLIRLVRSLPSFDGRSTFGTWAYRIATNCALDELRRRGRRPGVQRAGSADGPTLVTEPVDERALVAFETVTDRAQVEAALAELAEDHRVILVLREVADLEYAEIGAALGLPAGTVRSRLARARAALTEALGNPAPPTGRPTPRTAP